MVPPRDGGVLSQEDAGEVISGTLAGTGGHARDLITTVAVTVAVSLPTFLVGALAVEIRDSLRLSTSELGIAISISYFGAAIWSVPSGKLAERIGGIRVLKLAAFAGAVLLALLAFITSSWVDFALLLFPCGMVSVSVATASNLFLLKRSDPKRRGLSFGIKQAAVPTASLLGGLAVPTIALTVGWRYAFLTGAALAFVAALSVPKPSTTLKERRIQALGRTKSHVAKMPLVVLSIGFGLGVMAASGMVAFVTTAAVAIGISRPGAGLVAALAGATAVGVRIITGLLADRREGRHFYVVAAMMVVGAGGYLILAYSVHFETKWLFVIGAAVALGAGWGWNGLFNFALVRAHPDAPATATGITQLGGRIGGLMGPFLVGSIAQHLSYSVAFTMTGCSGILAATAIIIGRRLLISSRDGPPIASGS